MTICHVLYPYCFSTCVLGNLSCTGEVCAPPECEAGEYMCPDSEQCIPRMFLCDRQNDCLDGSDEANCSE